MVSAIYEGYVRHRRYVPKEHSFRYAIFFLYLDLAEMETAFRSRWLWSVKGVNVAYLRRRDHFGDPAVPIDTAVRDLVQQKTGIRPAGPIRMMCHLRYFGHNFNPATFYYCYDASDRHVETIIVEVHNTPWGEVFCYVLDRAQNVGTKAQKRFRLTKAFHVSPFIDMDVEYDWSFTEPGPALNVHMINMEKGEKIFEADLAMTRREISGPGLALMLIRYPFMTVKVVAGIYWQALRLWMKGVPVYSHPPKSAGVVK